MPGQKIFVIGDEDAVFGLGLVGLEGRVVKGIEEARTAIRTALADPENALILLTEDFSEARPDVMEMARALVVEIPNPGAPRISASLEAQVERALGTRLEK